MEQKEEDTLRFRSRDVRCNKNCIWPTKCASCTRAKVFIHPIVMPYGLRTRMVFSLNSSFESYQETKQLYKTSDWFQLDNYVKSLYSIFEDSSFDLDRKGEKIITKYMADILCDRCFPFLYNTEDGWVCTESSSIPKDLERVKQVQKELRKQSLPIDDVVQLFCREWETVGSLHIFKMLSSDLFQEHDGLQIALQLFLWRKLGLVFPGKVLSNDAFCADLFFGNLK